MPRSYRAVILSLTFLSSITLSLAGAYGPSPGSPSTSPVFNGPGSGPGKCSRGRKASSQKCCVWYDILDEIQQDLFSGGKCDEVAHDALRLTFHDAIGWSKSLKQRGQFPGGGADGSIIKFWDDVESKFWGNVGLDEIIHQQKPIADRYGVSYGDLIYFAGAVSVRNCAGGPRLQFLAGRPDAVAPSPDDLLPDAADSVEKILRRMDDADFSPEELVDLLASHSIGFQEHIDPSIAYTPFDSTNEVLDSQFFLETLLKGDTVPGDRIHAGQAMSPMPGEFRLWSDHAIARHPETACRWQSFIQDQPLMSAAFKKAMDKLALVGQDRSRLTDCSEVIPPPIFNFEASLPAKLPPGKTVGDIEFSCGRRGYGRLPGIKSRPGRQIRLPLAFGHKHKKSWNFFTNSVTSSVYEESKSNTGSGNIGSSYQQAGSSKPTTPNTNSGSAYEQTNPNPVTAKPNTNNNPGSAYQQANSNPVTPPTYSNAGSAYQQTNPKPVTPKPNTNPGSAYQQVNSKPVTSPANSNAGSAYQPANPNPATTKPNTNSGSAYQQASNPKANTSSYSQTNPSKYKRHSDLGSFHKTGSH